MADRKVKVVLDADAGPMVRGFRQAEASVKGFSSTIAANRASWDRIGSTALVAGGAMAAGLGLAAKAAIDWESAWAGVTKTVDGTDAQMAQLESGLRGLAKELPATHEEIAGVAEAAGQLGVARGDILAFTETAIALGESTNLSAEEASTSLAQFSNIMGTATREGAEGYERLGSTLVELGNNGASTERDIMQMAVRLAGAGQQIGATEADVLAMANALSSVGIEAQLGGGAMSRAMLQMNSAVIGGGDELEKFAEIAGMSASKFAQQWREDPIAATNAFIAGLGRVGDSGGDASAALESVGLAGTQNAQVLLRAAGASDLMTDSLEMGASAWEENSALQEEAAKRYETTESRMRIAMNTFKDAAIDLGSVLGPALAFVAEKAASVANAFVQLPGPVKGAAGALAGVAASALLIGGATIKAIGWTQDFRATLDEIGIKSGPRTDRALRGVAKAGAALAIFMAVRATMGALQGIFDEAVPSAEQLARALDNLAKSGDLSEINEGIERLDVKKSSASAVAINDMGEAVRFLSDQSAADKTRDWVQGLVGMDSDVDRLTGYVKGLDQELANMFDQDPTKAMETWATMVTETRKAGGSVEDLRKQFPLAAAAAKAAAEDGGAFEDHLSATEQAAADAEEAIDGLKSAIEGLGGGLRAERAAQRDFKQGLVDIKETIKEGTFDEQSAALDDLADNALKVASAQIEMGRGSDVVSSTMARAREQIIQAGVDSGRSRAYMEQYADAMGLIPEDVKTQVEAAGVTQSTANIMAMDDQIQLLNGKTVSVKEEGANPSKGRVMKLDGEIFGLKGKTVKVEEIGSTPSGDRVVRLNGKIYTLKGKTVDVTARTHGEQALANLQAQINRMSGRDVHVNTYYTQHRKTVDMGTWKARWAGGIEEHKMAAGGVLGPGELKPGVYGTSRRGIHMAEDTRSKWEAYIPERPDLRPRALGILDDVAERFGRKVIPMAEGGVREMRRYVPATPREFTRTPPPAPPVSVGPSAGQMEQAFTRALSRMQPVVHINGRDFHGVMKRTTHDRKGR